MSYERRNAIRAKRASEEKSPELQAAVAKMAERMLRGHEARMQGKMVPATRELVQQHQARINQLVKEKEGR